ncbi:unnamed protein product [Caenorhabditis auriculariae]|uniref:Uncharacterized protein n=1 Tax=Caenorhabditis auriculariae TaxID=2777116 RepID=A0A8S1HPP9_9PELO|nr:unnamed protein product [Caenorhabditis auriculariae]
MKWLSRKMEDIICDHIYVYQNSTVYRLSDAGSLEPCRKLQDLKAFEVTAGGVTGLHEDALPSSVQPLPAKQR